MKFCIAIVAFVTASHVLFSQNVISMETWSDLHTRGIEEYLKGNYSESIKLFSEARTVAENQVGKMHPQYARSCNSLANAYTEAGKLIDAKNLYSEALQLRQQLIGKKTRDYAITLFNQGRLYRLMGDSRQSEKILLEAAGILLEVKGKQDPEYSECLAGLSVVYLTLKDTLKSKNYLSESLLIRQHATGSDSVRMAVHYHGLGNMYKEVGHYEQAGFFLKKTIGIRSRLLGRQSVEYLYALNSLTQVYLWSGQFLECEKLYLDLLAGWKNTKGELSNEYAYVVAGLASLYQTIEQNEKSEFMYDQLVQLRIKVNGDHSTELADAFSSRGWLKYTKGNFSAAEQDMLKAYDIMKVTSDFSTLHARIIDNLGSLYMALGGYDKAESYYLAAKAIRENTEGTRSYNYISSLNNLALLYQKNGNYKVADTLYETAIEIVRESFPYDTTLALNLINNRGTLYDDRGFQVKAEECYTQVKDVEAGRDIKSIIYAQACANLANVYYLTDRREESVGLLLEAISIFEKIYNENHPQCIDLLSNLALTYYEIGDYERANSLYKKLNSKVFDQIQRYFPYLSGKERENFYQVVQKKFEFYNSLILFGNDKYEEGVGELYNNQLVIKGLLFNSDNRIRDKVLASGNDSLKLKYLEWKSLRNRLVKAYNAHSEVDTSEKLETEINALEKDLAMQLDVSKNENHANVYSWRDIEKNLSKNEAAVELIRFRTYGANRIVTDSSDSRLPRYIFKGYTDTVYYAALIITKGLKQPVAVVLKNGNELENKLVKNYRNQIRFKLLDTISYSRYWKPIHDGIVKLNKRIKTVYVSPDGVYNLINLRTLYDPDKQNFLADEVTIQTVVKPGNVTGNKSEKNISSETYRAVLFGYPDFKWDGDSETTGTEVDRSIEVEGIQRFFDEGKISDLPGTKEEVQQIDWMLKKNGIKASTYVYAQATEDTLKRINHPQLLHIATHGFFLEDLSTQSKFAGFDSKTILKNPLLRSGLLLAGSQHAFSGNKSSDVEDGILTAYEAMNLNLDGTELVVLSACETGLGEIRNGEGVYGLQRAFQTAGAKSLLMSLWKVDDTATQELMTSFYKNWLKSGDKRKAFNEAQASIKAKYIHPYYWGAFVLVGE